jgi:hypothetical protein
LDLLISELNGKTIWVISSMKNTGNIQAITFTGSCLCGEAQYSVTTEIEDFYLCHCQQCRKITGSAFTSNIQTKPVDVLWISGSEKVKRFDYSGTRTFSKVFCTECGSGLPYLNEKGSALIIPAGSLNEHPPLRPRNNVFWKDKAQWYEAGIRAPHCPGFLANATQL